MALIKQCISCGVTRSALAPFGRDCKDGFLCNDCIEKYGLSYLKNEDLVDLEEMSFSEIKNSVEYAKRMTQIIAGFRPTTSIGDYVKFDDKSKKMLVSSRDVYPSPRSFALFSYDQIVGYELIENGNTSITDAVGGAIMGGMLFGGAGAVVGGNAMGSSQNCTQLQIKLTVKGYTRPAFYITYFDANYTATIGSEKYNQKIKSAHDLLAKLAIIFNERKAVASTFGFEKTASEKNVQSNININPDNIEPTITRIELFLEDSEWENAKAYANTALDYFPTDYRLYLYLLFAELQVSSYDELANSNRSFIDNKNYKKVLRFADREIVEKLESCSKSADANKENKSESVIKRQTTNELNNESSFDVTKPTVWECSVCGRVICDYTQPERCPDCGVPNRFVLYGSTQESGSTEKTGQMEHGDRFHEIVEERKKLILQLKDEQSANNTILERIEDLESQLLKRADIIRNADNTYSFKGYSPVCRSDGRQLYFDSNEWIAIGRTEEKILLLSKYCVLAFEAYTNDIKGTSGCSWEDSIMNIRLNNATSRITINNMTWPSMIKGFTVIQRVIIGSIGLLTSAEVEEFLPDKRARLLKFKGEPGSLAWNNWKNLRPKNQGDTLEWMLKDPIESDMVTIVNSKGEIAKEKYKRKGFLGEAPYNAAIRPAIWIEIEKLTM